MAKDGLVPQFAHLAQHALYRVNGTANACEHSRDRLGFFWWYTVLGISGVLYTRQTCKILNTINFICERTSSLFIQETERQDNTDLVGFDRMQTLEHQTT